jgi:NAD(P)-dependent dehydrogenase (short-subunit alcohol dehydrogenase family)
LFNRFLSFFSAGIFAPGAIDTVSAETWSHLLSVNVLGSAFMAKAVVPLLKKQRSGAIIQTASVSSWIAHPDFVAYSTTKGAVLQMTRNLALDLGPFNIRCNAICPGTIITPATTKLAADLNITMDQFADRFTPMQCIKRLGTTQEIANLAVFLASDLCHFITGASFTADGGYTAV